MILTNIMKQTKNFGLSLNHIGYICTRVTVEPPIERPIGSLVISLKSTVAAERNQSTPGVK